MIDEAGARYSLRAMKFAGGPSQERKHIRDTLCNTTRVPNVGASVPLVRGTFLKKASRDNNVAALMRHARPNSTPFTHFGYTKKACLY